MRGKKTARQEKVYTTVVERNGGEGAFKRRLALSSTSVITVTMLFSRSLYTGTTGDWKLKT